MKFHVLLPPVMIDAMARRKKWEAFEHLTPRQRHEGYFGPGRLLKELTLLGHMHLLDALPNSLIPHKHPGTYEFHYLESGNLSVWAGARKFTLAPGSFFMTLPDELHGGVNKLLQPAKWYWILVRFPARRTLPGLSASETRALQRAFDTAPARVCTASRETHDAFIRLITEHRTRPPHAKLVARAVFHELLASLARDLHAGSASRPRTRGIAQAVKWIEAHLGEASPVATMAQVAGLSESRFRERFHAETGFAPADYVMRQRIARARELLRQGSRSITDIAFELGFNTSAYFSSVFKRQTGQSPREFRGTTC